MSPPCLVPLSVSTGRDWWGLLWAESGKATDLEVKGPNSLDSLLKIVLVY